MKNLCKLLYVLGASLFSVTAAASSPNSTACPVPGIDQTKPIKGLYYIDKNIKLRVPPDAKFADIIALGGGGGAGGGRLDKGGAGWIDFNQGSPGTDTFFGGVLVAYGAPGGGSGVPPSALFTTGGQGGPLTPNSAGGSTPALPTLFIPAFGPVTPMPPFQGGRGGLDGPLGYNKSWPNGDGGGGGASSCGNGGNSGSRGNAWGYPPAYVGQNGTSYGAGGGGTYLYIGHDGNIGTSGGYGSVAQARSLPLIGDDGKAPREISIQIGTGGQPVAGTPQPGGAGAGGYMIVKFSDAPLFPTTPSTMP